jgi:Protein of unknown function (DUF1036)
LYIVVGLLAVLIGVASAQVDPGPRPGPGKPPMAAPESSPQPNPGKQPQTAPQTSPLPSPGKPLLTEPGAALPQTALVRVCNRNSPDPLFVSLVIRPDPARPDEWVVRGWWRVDDKQCLDTARTLRRGHVFAYAEDGRTSWSGVGLKDAIERCVEYPGPFSRVITNEYTCPGRRLKSFLPQEIRADLDTHTITFQLAN